MKKYVCLAKDEKWILNNISKVLKKYISIANNDVTKQHLEPDEVYNASLVQLLLNGDFDTYVKPFVLAQNFMYDFGTKKNATYRDLFENTIVAPRGTGFNDVVTLNATQSIHNETYQKEAVKFLETYKYNENLDRFWIPIYDDPRGKGEGHELKPLVTNHGVSGAIDLIRQFETAKYGKVKTNLSNPYATLLSLNTIRFEIAFDNIVSPWASEKVGKDKIIQHVKLDDEINADNIKALWNGVTKYIDVYKLN